MGLNKIELQKKTLCIYKYQYGKLKAKGERPLV